MNEAKAFYELAMTEINRYVETIDYEQLQKAAKLILNSEKDGGRVHVTGIGKPSYVAGYTASLLSSTGTKAYFLDGTEAVHGSSGQVASGDVVIAISNSGETVELRASVETLLNNGAKLIAVTGNKESWLAASSDVFLHAGVNQEGDSMNKPPRASIITEMLILQGLSVILQEAEGLTPEVYVNWHPGGALGASIKKDQQ